MNAITIQQSTPPAPHRDPAPVEALDMSEVKVDPACALRVPANVAVRRQVLPFAIRNQRVHVACANPNDEVIFQTLQRYLRLPVQPELAEAHSLRRAIARVYGDANSGVGGARWRSIDVRQQSIDLDEADAVALCDQLLHAAVLHQASDIHIDPQANAVRVRFRIDGQLEHYCDLPSAAHAAIISRLKVLSGLDIAEKRSPQDGGFTHRHTSTTRPIDVRTATLPTRHGERVTLRLLALETESLTLEKLGMAPGHLEIFSQAISKPHGLILLTGPTGSGKTTTLYAALNAIVGPEKKVITTEDPVEYNLEGVNQIPVDHKVGMSFAMGLRAILRHDPDVVMIGEIRDLETAQAATQASLTGHLVLSTLHTNDAASAATRLIDMGVEPFLVSSTLSGVMAQRLVRVICPTCKTEIKPSEAGLPKNMKWPKGAKVFTGSGCRACRNSGYRGRTGLYELLTMNEELGERIIERVAASELVRIGRANGMRLLSEDGWLKVRNGVTTPDEVLRVTAA